MTVWGTTFKSLGRILVLTLTTGICTLAQTKSGPVDPGVRSGPAAAGTPLKGLTTDETAFFQDGRNRFAEIEVVAGGSNNGLGPRFKSNQCASCHLQPALGGTSPAKNPLPDVAHLAGATNKVPWFIVPDGPVREARFQKSNGQADGNVHDLFVITGRSDAPGCNIAQFDFLPAGNALTGQGGNPNIIFRIPTPVFGAGLIEAIPDGAILANIRTNAAEKLALGISGHANAILSGNVNRSGNDGTITRFGWKAQNKSLLMFAGEAYNVEMGVSNELFPNERSAVAGCVFNPTPEDATNIVVPGSGGTTGTASGMSSDIVNFAAFMRMSAPPAPTTSSASQLNGQALFAVVGCALCHSPSLTTAASIYTGMGGVTYQPFSDFAIHHMGANLADGITQGLAGPDQFRTAPLWGVGQRLFFLHDGRTSDLLQAILAHGGPNSEAQRVVEAFQLLGKSQ